MDYRKIIFALTLFVFFQQCTKRDTPSVSPTENPPIVKQDTSIRYLALGDSYTIGERVTTPERYPEQLVEALRLSGIKIQSLRIIARTGWTTDELSNAMDDAKINDSTYNMVDSYTPQFEALLKRAIQLAGGKKEKVFVVSIPDYAYTPFGNGSTLISEGIDAYNAVNKDITQKYGIQYFNITPISREGLTDKALVATDGLHPSGKQYGRWVNLMLEDVKKLLK
jgi:GDSL-like Lipase/Acylhydrolase family